MVSKIENSSPCYFKSEPNCIVYYLGRAVCLLRWCTRSFWHVCFRNNTQATPKQLSSQSHAIDLAPVQKINQVSWRNFAFRKNKAPSKCKEIAVGNGIKNGGATCYVASALQALRFVSFFRERLNKLKKIELVQELKRLFAILEKERTLTSEEISAFRQLCLRYGWTKVGYTQEDAREFSRFLFEQLGFPNFRYEIKTSHNFDLPIRIPSLNPEQVFEDSYLELPMQDAHENCELNELVRNGFVLEVIEKDALPKDVSSEVREKINKLEDKTDLPSHKAIVLHEIPYIIPISLIRDLKCGIKSTKSIIASPQIDLFLKKDRTRMAHYRLVSLMVDDGYTTDSGHYRTFVPRSNGNYLEFDDSRCTQHHDAACIESTINQHAVFFYYELVGVN